MMPLSMVRLQRMSTYYAPAQIAAKGILRSPAERVCAPSNVTAEQVARTPQLTRRKLSIFCALAIVHRGAIGLHLEHSLQPQRHQLRLHQPLLRRLQLHQPLWHQQVLQNRQQRVRRQLGLQPKHQQVLRTWNTVTTWFHSQPCSQRDQLSNRLLNPQLAPQPLPP